MTLEAVGPILTLALAFGLIRVFEGDRWVIPVLIAALSSHLLALSARRIGWGVPVSALVGGVGLILVITWTHYRDTTFWGLPARSTWSALINDQDQAWAALGNLSPPVEPLNGFIVSAMAAVWALAFFNDWAAMRTRTLLESLLLPIAVTGLVGLIGDERHRMLTIGVFIAALLLFVWIHRVVARTTGAAWLGGESRAPDGRRAMLLAGALPAAIALAAAVLVGPVLGDHDDPLLDLTGIADRDDSGTERFVISPLVDIRGRLVNQAETVMFRVRADQRSYWRLTSLDRFDGQVWTSRADYAESPSRLPSQFPSGTSVEQSSQEYHIEQLAAVWLPAAFEPRYLDSDITDISYEPSSSTLIVGRSLANSDNLTYTVVSAVPRFDPEALRAIPSSAPTSPDLARYTRLPSDFSPRIRELAAEIGGGTGSDYEQALALQNFFRDGSFIYDTSTAGGHSENRIESFLETRRGYCEQFAGTFAAMARSLGLPARVAVGFTVGESDPSDPGLYRVRGQHAHAWPEVFLNGAGWVAFEPTPGRGAPGAQNYTGVAESQHTGDTVTPPSGEDLPPDPDPDSDIPIDFESLIGSELADSGETPTGGGDGNGKGTRIPWPAILAPVLAVLLIASVPWLKRLQRKRRLGKAPGNRGRIKVVWAETIESLALINVIPRPDETHAEFAHRAIKQIPLHSPDLRNLGELVAAATFGPSEPTDRHQWLARTWSMSVRSEVRFRTSRHRRMIAAFNPQPLFTTRTKNNPAPEP
ncbi:transglutaminase TgpA family protein [Candidatus Poriferisocius sp.]|uniref:transglutaminase TgpA family protein n=1 Tax=Candidatus Poriferisocius sp. TaxID=3101276 RepID=UPI003B0178FE